MMFAHDVFSETNPAFCTFALAAFTTAFLKIKEEGPAVPTAYLALPVALSGELAGTFGGTNKNTGLLEWLERSPQVQLGLAARVNASMSMVTEAIRFGCFARVLLLDQSARLKLGTTKAKGKALNGLGTAPAQSIKHAERLGYWFAMSGSTRTVFDIMGLTL